MTAQAPETFPHAVSKGDSLASIAASYNIEVGRLKQANPGLEKQAEGDPLDRLKWRTVKVPRGERGTKVKPGLSHDRLHELEAPHRFAVLYAAQHSDLTGLFDVTAPDGEVLHDAIYGCFEIHYICPAGVPSVYWAAGLVPADDPPMTDFPKRAGYCAQGMSELKPKGGGGGGEEISPDKLKEAFGKGDRIWLSSGSFQVQPGPCRKTVRIVIAEEDASEESDDNQAQVLVPWKTVKINRLKADKRYRLALLSSNGKTAVDGAVSGDVHMVIVSLDVELPEIASGVPADRALEVRLHPPELTARELIHREEDEALNYCTDSIPLRRESNYKEKVGSEILGERPYTKHEEYPHQSRKIKNDVADHRIFGVDLEKGSDVDVPPYALLKVLAHGKKVLDQITEADRPEKPYDLKFQQGLYPYLCDYLRVRLFHREISPHAGARPEEIEAAEKQVEKAEEQLKKAEGEVRKLREEALRLASEERLREARQRKYHERRVALETEIDGLRRRLAEGGGAPSPAQQQEGARGPAPVQQAGDDPTPAQQANGAATPEQQGEASASPSQQAVAPGPRRRGIFGRRGDARLGYELAQREEELRRLWAEHRKLLEEADRRSREATSAEARRERELRERRAIEELKAVKARLREANFRLEALAAVELHEIVPVFAEPAPYGDVGSAIEPAATTVVAIIADHFDKLFACRLDGEKSHDRGEAKRSISESVDGTYLPPPEGAGGAGGLSRLEPSVIDARWSKRYARPDEEVTLEARVFGVAPGAKVKFRIFEKDETSPDDFIEEVVGTVEVGLARARWKCKYVEDTDDTVTDKEREQGFTEPEYYFVAKVGEGEKACEARSDLLLYQDWIEIEMRDDDGNPMAGEIITLQLPDGRQREATLDRRGYVRLDRIPPGRCRVTLGPASAQPQRDPSQAAAAPAGQTGQSTPGGAA